MYGASWSRDPCGPRDTHRSSSGQTMTSKFARCAATSNGCTRLMMNYGCSLPNGRDCRPVLTMVRHDMPCHTASGASQCIHKLLPTYCHSDSRLSCTVGLSLISEIFLTIVLLMGGGGGKIPPAHFRHQNCGTAKDQAMRFRDFFLNMDGLQNAVLIGGTPPTKNRIWPRKKRKYASRLLSFVAHIISRIPWHVVTKF